MANRSNIKVFLPVQMLHSNSTDYASWVLHKNTERVNICLNGLNISKSASGNTGTLTKSSLDDVHPRGSPDEHLWVVSDLLQRKIQSHRHTIRKSMKGWFIAKWSIRKLYLTSIITELQILSTIFGVRRSMMIIAIEQVPGGQTTMT